MAPIITPWLKYFCTKGVHTHDRHGGDDDDGVFHQVGQTHGLLGSQAVAGAYQRLVGDQDIAHHQLQGFRFSLRMYTKAFEVGVPLSHRDVQRDDGDDRLGQRAERWRRRTAGCRSRRSERRPKALWEGWCPKKVRATMMFIHHHGEGEAP